MPYDLIARTILLSTVLHWTAEPGALHDLVVADTADACSSELDEQVKSTDAEAHCFIACTSRASLLEFSVARCNDVPTIASETCPGVLGHLRGPPAV